MIFNARDVDLYPISFRGTKAVQICTAFTFCRSEDQRQKDSWSDPTRVRKFAHPLSVFFRLPQSRANLRDLILAQTSCAIGSDSAAFPRVRKFAHPFMPSDRRRIRKTGVPKNKHLPSSPPAGILAIVLFAKHGFNTFLAPDLFSCSLRMLQKGSVALRTIPVYSDLAFLW
jgi:hypothetical protein